MAINTINPVPIPVLPIGGFGTFKTIDPDTSRLDIGGGQFSRNDIPQVIGLVPVFPCFFDECRTGKFLNDRIIDDRLFPLPVFAQPSGSDLYLNDVNSWLFELPSSGIVDMDFYLDELVSGSWSQVAHLTDDTYGLLFGLPSSKHNVLCDSLNWTGYKIYWQNVLNTFGEGMFRFRIIYNFYKNASICAASPPFCLKTFDCYHANRTTKFEAFYSGGKFGSINKKDCGGAFWNFCCCKGVEGKEECSAIQWDDSIRIFGFFGREEKTKERNQIKYQTGVVNRIRDEAIRKFKWSSFGNTADNPGAGLPFWFHDRFAVYGQMADKLLASDYNLNNADYGIKRYCVRDDSDYSPKYKGSSRYSNVELAFKSGTEYLIRNRCC